MELERRRFLQQTGAVLLGLGFSQTGLPGWDRRRLLPAWLWRYSEALAVTTHRKLALLVGINNYGEYLALKGCETDVELQRELLIHRFGFQPQDIATLTAAEATREGIETAFREHLTAQAKAGDVVVFHFSGYGSQVSMPPSQARLSDGEVLVNSLVPSDIFVRINDKFRRNDLLEDTLWLLARSLKTDKLSFVLDTSHSPRKTTLEGNWRGRSFASRAEQANPGKEELQEQKTPGLVLRAAAAEQVALEMLGNGFSAGLFTYALSQFLWQVTPASKVMVALRRTTEQLAPMVPNQQQLCGQEGAKSTFFTYYLLPTMTSGAEGVIIDLESDRIAQVKLTGLPPNVLDAYGLNSCFSAVCPSSWKPQILQLVSRQGLVAKVQLLNPLNSPESSLSVGQLIQEAIRVLPRNIGLIVALAPQLERIERVDATSAFASVSAVSAVTVAGEQAADCVLGRVKDEQGELGEYGLFSPGGRLLPNTTGAASEAIKSAIERLTPALSQQLAAKIWGLTVNQDSSRLGVKVSLEASLEEDPQPLSQRQTRGQMMVAASPIKTSILDVRVSSSPILDRIQGIPCLAGGTHLQYRIENQSDRPIYYLFLGIDARGKAIAFTTEPQASIAPGESTLITRYVSGTAGLVQMQVICSLAPLTQTENAIAAADSLKPDQSQLFDLSDPLNVAHSLLQDLHTISAVDSKITGIATDSYALDVQAWATLSFVYQVVEGR